MYNIYEKTYIQLVRQHGIPQIFDLMACLDRVAYEY